LDKKTKEFLQELPIVLEPGGCVLIGIGIQFAVPWPWECQIRPRSGLANKFDIEMSNSPGTLDPDFRGEAGILLRSRSKEPFTVMPGMRIAQLVFATVKIPVLVESKELPSTIRGAGGFGSTGLFEISEGTEEFWKKVRERDAKFMKMVLAAAELRETIPLMANAQRATGCIIVKDDSVIAVGHNSVVLKDDAVCIWNAFKNLLRLGGVSTMGCALYTNAYDINREWVAMICDAGIKEVVLMEPYCLESEIERLQHSGVHVRKVDYQEGH
jgi:dUTP pyrophosphatase